ncbi:unnamed protein product [Rhizophagus irregularis]|uniref:Uncharacterized protein n=1 Tax=Rhizophagus irregularis TaxID=588596 RepID=A0A2I1GK13_9GLOM|nr:hypothetical protein RhiirA4_543670 [Rhizophagus irregularis]CAB4424209.1 unnamed protein product [Rhizophagus irregularis]
MVYFFNKGSNKKRKKIYQFKYEDTTLYKEFYGYLNPSQTYSIISLKRFVDHGLDCNRYRFGKVTNSNQLRNNKFSNIAGVCALTISFENSASGLNNIRINGSTTTPPGNGKKVEKKIRDVLVLKESDVEFRLGNDFISDTNAVIEPKPRSNYNKRKYTHQLRFKDGVIVDLEKVDNLHDFDEEEENVSSDEDDFDENDDYNDENSIASDTSNGCSKHNKVIKYKIFNNFLIKLNNHVGFWNFMIIITLLFIIFTVSYCSHKTHSLVEELVIPPYNNQFTKPGIDDKLEDYVRKLKATTSFLELFDLDKRQNPKTPRIQKASSSASSASSASTTPSLSSQQKEEGDRVEGEEELYTNLVKYTESLDNTKRTLLDMYNQEVTYAFIFQQNVENLAKYLSLKKRRNILRMIPLIGGDEYFPLTENFKGLVNNVDNIINNTLSVMDEMNTLQVYCERIIKQVEKLKDELKSFIVNGKSLTAWLKTLITKFTKKVDNLGEIDSETALKCQKLFIALDNDLRELLDLFKDLRINITSHLSSLFEFSEHFKFTERLTDLEINIIKKHLVNLQNNRRIIFSEVINILKDDKDDDICPAPSPIFPLVLPSNSQLALQNL